MVAQAEGTRIVPSSPKNFEKQPRLLVSLPYGMCARNFLRSDAHRILLKTCHQILLTPLADDPGFRQEMDKPGVTVVKMPSYGFIARGVGRVLCEAETMARLKVHPVDTFSILERVIKAGAGDPTILEHAGVFSWRSRLLAKLPRLRRLLRVLWLFLCNREAGNLLSQLSPDLIYVTHPHSSQDPVLAAAAEVRGIPCAAIVHSWDNLTSKRLWLNNYEKMIVWNDIMRRQAEEFCAYPAERLYVSGVPQLDSFIDASLFENREAFFIKNGWDPKRKLITFACGSPDFQPDQADILEDLWNAVENGRFKEPIQLVIRTHPGKKIPGLERLSGKAHVHVHDPSAAYGALAMTSGWNGDRHDQSFFLNLVKHSDVFVNCFSTTTIEAAALDRPVINIAYDGRRTLDYLASCVKHYDLTHYKPIVESKGVGIARSQKDFENLIEAYLKDPSKDGEGRRRLIREQCGVLDGKAGQRIADELNKMLKIHAV